ncbi:MAG: tRNA (adenosine(37)-N6)-threonylcarbamoyltransferase complex transferase subunit TsaD, partial [Chloroflexota bacterium]|nr:tRNA (adenosine(37)-N6)-threonylcarbamoyltransferase complex transferase subunit TsaD [Chloroflexota bacterium]
TALLRAAREMDPQDIPALAHAFQESVVDILARKTAAAARDVGAAEVAVCGGVAANQRLRERLQADLGRDVRFPRLEYCTDNAAMIGACGFFSFQRIGASGLDIDVDPNLDLVA